MRPRQELTEIFSTFIEFEADRFSKWLMNLRLYRNVQNCIQQFPKASISEELLARYWYQSWEDLINSLPKLHLLAYLQEPCYWAAQQIYQKYPNFQYSRPDYFQFAIAELNSVLRGFDPSRRSSLSIYAKIAFSSRLQDILRRRRETDGVTTWTLLRCRIGKKGLIEALQYGGLSNSEIDQYWLAWVCFKTVYTPTQPNVKRLPEPDRSVWETVAKLYNAERHKQLNAPGSPVSPETIEQWMRKVAAYVRSFLHPPIDSLSAPLADGQEIDLPDPKTDSGLSLVILEEELQNRRQQQQQMTNLLNTTLQQLDPKTQSVLRLYYQQNQTQQQIAAQLEMSQPTVVRRLRKARDELLGALVKWSRDELNIFPTLNLIEERGTALEEWLQFSWEQASDNENAEGT